MDIEKLLLTPEEINTCYLYNAGEIKPILELQLEKVLEYLDSLTTEDCHYIGLKKKFRK